MAEVERWGGLVKDQDVEAKRDEHRDWEPGKVRDFDKNDPEGMFYVEFTRPHDYLWVAYNEIRPLAADTKPAIRYEYRRVGGAGLFSTTGTDWSPLNLEENTVTGTLSINIPANAGMSRIEIRRKPSRSESEILTKLREHAKTFGVGPAVRKILEGEF